MASQYKDVFPKKHTRFMTWLIRIFYRHKIINVPKTGDEPVVLVCNHNCVYGPVVASAFIPIKNSPWVSNKMLNYAEAKKETESGLIYMGWAKWIAKPLSAIITKLIISVINAKEPVSVYRDSRAISTMRNSLKAMQNGKNILVFPENPQSSGWDYFQNDNVAEFHDGFVYLADLYYRKTGKPLTFYSIYCDKGNRTITFSEAVTYQPQNGADNERVRIAQVLYKKMKTMCDHGKDYGLLKAPIHTPIENTYYGGIGDFGAKRYSA